MENVRDRAIRAAEELLKEEGIYSLTLNRVLAKAGVSKGGFFHHFATKEELVHALLESGMASYQREMESLRQTGMGETEARIRTSFNRIRRTDPLTIVAVAAVATDGALSGLMSARVKESVQAGIDEGLPPDQVKLALLAVQGLFLERLFGVEPTEAEIDDLERIVLNLIRPT